MRLSARIRIWRTAIQSRTKYIWDSLTGRKGRIDSPPVFIVGCGHSGTSILLAILDAHSRIYAVPYETKIAAQKSRKKFHRALKRFDRWAISVGKQRWVEKTPNHIRHIDKILQWRSDAKIIIMIRDGRDVAFSIKKRQDNIEKGIKRWVNDNLAGKAYWEHPNIHVIRYEDLIIDFEFYVRELLNFLGEKYEPGMKNHHQVSRKWYSSKIEKPSTEFRKNHRQFRNWQINQPLFDGRGQWKKMSQKELTLVHELAGELLAEFGYTEKAVQ